MRLTTLNLKHGGTQSPDGTPDGRWNATVDAINDERPDILCLQEIHGWREHNHQALLRAERDLGMRTAGWVPPVASAPPTGGTLVMYRHRPEHVEMLQWESKESTALRNGLGVAVFRLHGCVPLAVASLHLPPYCAATAAAEAKLAASRAVRYGPFGVLAGDINHHPLRGAAPDPASVPPLNRMGRWTQDPAGRTVPDRRVAQALADGGYTDAAAHIADVADRPDLLEATGRGGVRVDQVWVSAALLRGVIDARARSTEASDHKMVRVDFDPDLLDTDDTPDLGWN